ncbi:MAG: hypothetical protein RBT15_04205 [Gudongella sp.]|nr:hypothetical protein [Gudongella sp.]
MDRLDIVNGLVFQNLEIYSKDSLSDRIILQKKIYLFQEMGADLGYRYNWYLKGPYSPSLTTFVYDKLEYLQQSTDEFRSYKLTENIEEIIQKINSLSDKKPYDLGLDSWFELLASIKYIYENPFLWNVEGDIKIKELIEIIRREKPQFTDEHCREAINVLTEINLIRDKVEEYGQ